jgi:hypothetical protein
MQEVIKSQFHDIFIKFTGWDEPNNGRMLHTADLVINGQVQNEKYFDDWNRLDEKLDKVTFDSPDKKFVYVPAESGGFLINTETYEKVKLPYKRISTVTFIGNFFIDKILVLVHIDEIILFNTANNISTRNGFPDVNIIWCDVSEDKKLVVTYYDKKTNSKTRKVFDFEKLELL